jgi:hypothetical protein
MDLNVTSDLMLKRLSEMSDSELEALEQRLHHQPWVA